MPQISTNLRLVARDGELVDAADCTLAPSNPVEINAVQIGNVEEMQVGAPFAVGVAAITLCSFIAFMCAYYFISQL